MPFIIPSLGLCFLTIFVATLTYVVLQFARNIRAARQTGLPYVVVLFSEVENINKLFCRVARKIWRKYLLKGDGWPRWVRLSIMAWQWEDKGRAHEEYGDVFLAVSPKALICYCADAEVAFDILSRRNDFIKARDQTKRLELYGPNIGTAEGKVFQHHQRITVPSFSDATKINDAVWDETTRLTRALADGASKGGARDLAEDIRKLTLGVICCTGFGKKVDFVAEVEPQSAIPDGFKMSLYHALHLVTSNVVSIFTLWAWFLRVVGKGEILLAQQQMEQHMREIVRTETARLEKGGENLEATRPNLLTSILRASSEQALTEQKRPFTENEVLGNIFAFLLAGYETTSGMIHYALIMLALLPEVQDKIRGEVNRAYTAALLVDGRHELTYANDFSKLEYIYGFMYEILRLFPSLAGIKKQVIDRPVPVSLPGQQGRQVCLPANSVVILNSSAVHYSERYWPDPKVIKPERWNEDRLDSGTKGNVDRAKMVKAKLQTFSNGGRSCIGRRFAQSEFVSFVATLLREYRVELGDGVDPVAIKQSIETVSAGSLTLSPSESVPLILKKRSETEK